MSLECKLSGVQVGDILLLKGDDGYDGYSVVGYVRGYSAKRIIMAMSCGDGMEKFFLENKKYELKRFISYKVLAP